MKNFNQRDFLWILPLSLGLERFCPLCKPGNWLIGWLGFSFLFLLTFSLLTLSTRWAMGLRATLGTRKTLAWMVALAFALRFAGGVATYLVLPINGFDDEDDKAGFVYTDAHRRDAQAWELASSDRYYRRLQSKLCLRSIWRLVDDERIHLSLPLARCAPSADVGVGLCVHGGIGIAIFVEGGRVNSGEMKVAVCFGMDVCAVS